MLTDPNRGHLDHTLQQCGMSFDWQASLNVSIDFFMIYRKEKELFFVLKRSNGGNIVRFEKIVVENSTFLSNLI